MTTGPSVRPSHWNAGCRGSELVFVDARGEEHPAGFLSWDDARNCLLFDLDDRLREATATARAAPRAATGGDGWSEDEVRAAAAELERARPGWIYACRLDPAAYWILVCELEDCRCELIDGPGGERRQGRRAAL